jgi:hypothetical protein
MTSDTRHSKDSAEALEDFHYRRIYETEVILSRFARSMHEAMVKTKKTQKDIASITEKSAQSVSRALSAEQNLTVSKMVELSLALGCKVDLSVTQDPGIVVMSDESFDCENIITFNIGSKPKPAYIYEDGSEYSSHIDPTKVG